MPPFLTPRAKVETILTNDEQLNPLNFTNTSMVFTDISLNLPNKVINSNTYSPIISDYLYILDYNLTESKCSG